MTSAPNAILNLVERFHNQLDAYRSGRYKETPLRREFIDPLFEALGWDINNPAGYAEAYRDVIHEDAIKVGGVTKAPDYQRVKVDATRAGAVCWVYDQNLLACFRPNACGNSCLRSLGPSRSRLGRASGMQAPFRADMQPRQGA